MVLGMGKEVENLILENNELLATKWVYTIIFNFFNFFASHLI